MTFSFPFDCAHIAFISFFIESRLSLYVIYYGKKFLLVAFSLSLCLKGWANDFCSGIDLRIHLAYSPVY